jgi:hypothetical protein
MSQLPFSKDAFIDNVLDPARLLPASARTDKLQSGNLEAWAVLVVQPAIDIGRFYLVY